MAEVLMVVVMAMMGGYGRTRERNERQRVRMKGEWGLKVGQRTAGCQ